MRWTTREIRYLEDHAHEGAPAIAKALGRSTEAVRQQAKAYGISLAVRSLCPACGRWTRKPLNTRTGWCPSCTKEARLAELEKELVELEEEAMREQRINRRRQAVYSRKNRLKKPHIKDTRHEQGKQKGDSQDDQTR